MTFGRCKLLEEWPDWDNTIHADAEQISRQGRAITYPFTFKINKKFKRAKFSSTSDLPYYVTTMHDCTCYDYQYRHLPCKHIYRLAMELGVIEIINRAPGGYDKDRLSQIKELDHVDSAPEQIKRLEKAKDPKYTPVSIDYNFKTAVFLGSGKKPYETTLDTCTCKDYFVRRLPCKHIYRLRLEIEKHNG